MSETESVNSPASANRDTATPTCSVVGLGASAGGLEALAGFFRALPPNSGAAFVVVVHLAPNFKSLMPELVARHTDMPVKHVQQGMLVEPDNVYVIAPRKNITLEGGRIRLHDQDRQSRHAINLPVDDFLISLAEHHGARAIAVILSGSGSDGTRGIKAIATAGGLVLAQDPASAKFDGMPQSAIATGHVDYIGFPGALASRVMSILSRSDGLTLDVPEDGADTDARSVYSDEIDAVLDVVRQASDGLDLSYYKRTTVQRRIHRRMTVLGVDDIGAYLQRIREDTMEQGVLQRDILINVTSFFRDASTFRNLKSLLPDLLNETDRPFRVWVPACSTGEEAYSIAMMIEEANLASDRPREFTVFATDVDKRALKLAGRGVFNTSMIADIPRATVGRFFEHRGGMMYKVRPRLRERLVFAPHNLVRDPAFSRMDLVSCRNFLIYVEPPERETVLASLHFSLVVGGVLMLGKAESTAPFNDEFDALFPTEKIYRKRRRVLLPAARSRETLGDPVAERKQLSDESIRGVFESLATFESRTFVLLDASGHVLDVIGDAAGLLRVPRGKPTDDIRKLIVDDLVVAVASALRQALQGEPVSYRVWVKGSTDLPESSGYHVHLQLRELAASRKAPKRLLLIAARHDGQSANDEVPRSSAYTASVDADEINTLETQLRHMQDDLQSTIEELQSTNEEQQSTNEELLASNEELQSTNEELHSLNEELRTVNEEFQLKNRQLQTVTTDWLNLMNVVDAATIFVDKNLTIRRFSPGLDPIMTLVDHDVGRPIKHLAHSVDKQLLEDIERVAADGGRVDRHIHAADGTWQRLRVEPYVNPGRDEIDGVVIAFQDVSDLRNVEESAALLSEQLERANERLLQRTDELEEVFSIVAHDVRRPVGAIDGMLRLTREDLEASRAENVRAPLKYVDTALSECVRLQRLLTDLRHIATIERTQISLEQVDLQTWLDEEVAPFRERARGDGVEFNCACDRVVVRLARGAIEQALRNLLENALHYGTSNAKPRVDVAATYFLGTLRISVSDNGRGIAKRYHERVFELFRRLDPSVAEGSGIGLVSARRLISKAGGEVTLESEAGKGAQFTITIPAERVGQKPREYHVLLVESDPVDARQIHNTLDSLMSTRKLNACVSWAKSLAEARELIANRSFDAVVLELSLPDGHGLSLVKGLNSAGGEVRPVIILSRNTAGISESMLDKSALAVFLPKRKLSVASLGKALDAAISQTQRRFRLSRPGFLPPSQTS